MRARKSFWLSSFSPFDFLSTGSRGNASAAHEKYSSSCFGIQGLSPIARPGRFLARSNSHPVVARNDCTKILLAAAGLKRTRPFYEAAFRPCCSSVRPPGSARTDHVLEDFSSLRTNFPVRARAFCLRAENRVHSAQISPARTLCFDIFSPPPGDSEVINQLERLSSIETKIARRSLRMALGA